MDTGRHKIIPTLDSVGWVVDDTREKIDRALANFFTSDGSQSTLYMDAFKTYQVLAQENTGDPERLAESMQLYLTQYLGKYFDNTNVEVTVEEIPNDFKEREGLTDGAVAIRLNVHYVDNGDYNEFQKPLIYDKGIFNYVLDKFNQGAV